MLHLNISTPIGHLDFSSMSHSALDITTVHFKRMAKYCKIICSWR